MGTCSPEGQQYPGLRQRDVASREIKGIVSLYSALGGPYGSLRPSAHERHGAVGTGPQEATEMIGGWSTSPRMKG